MRRGPIAFDRSSTGWGLNALSDDALDRIHAATLDVLQTTGVQVGNEEALKILDNGGCWVNRKTQVVRFPAHIVTQALATCPSHILLAGRDSAQDFMMGGRQVGFTTFGTGVQILDMETGELRHSFREDVAVSVRLADAMEHVDMVTIPIYARDQPDSSVELHMAEVSFANTGKHFQGDTQNGEVALKYIQMAEVVAGGKEELRRRPIVSLVICPTSPLQLIGDMCEVIIEAARHWLPVNILSMAMAGASTPISVSGALVTHNAEVLAGITLAQITNPGAPVWYGSSTTTFDMKVGTATVGAPEMAMISAAVAGLANYYNLPSYVGGL